MVSRFHVLLLLSILGAVALADDETKLADALLFHASFDKSADAEVAKGDGKLYTAQSLKREKVRAGLQGDDVVLQSAGGRFGGALQFRRKTNKIVFFKVGKNLSYGKDRFDSTISLWMRLNPDKDLPAGYVDPLQITDKKWNDASIFLDFTKETPRRFRLGVFSDYKFWNPSNRKWDDIPESERPLVSVAKPPFDSAKWTHVAITIEGVNSEKNAVSTLYLNGKRQGSRAARERFTWDPAKAVMMLGIYYVGGIDDLAIFDRALSKSEVERLHRLPRGVSALR